jgi:DNA methyltransferase 1-associated protein 1
MDGISRELYALLGDNTPSLTFAQSHIGDGLGSSTGGAGRFMPKFKKRPQKVQKWSLASFKNPARRDDLTLRHWVSASERQIEEKEEDVPREYRFADLNTSSGVYRYSNDEYHQHLRDEDWTKEETDYLIDLCNAYDLRFVVIADRYDWHNAGGKQRTMEDLKARYYAICRRLIRSRISSEDTDARQQLLQSYTFDRAREQERKKHVLRLFSRTPQQLAEEEALYVEARRLEQNESRFAAEREELLRLLGGWERLPNVRGDTVAAAGSGVGGSSVQDDEAAAAAADAARRNRKRKADDGSVLSDAGAGAVSANAAPAPPLSAKQKAEKRSQYFDEVHNITRFDTQAAATLANSKPPYPHLMGTPSTFPPVATTTNNPSASHGAYLRSTRLLVPRTNLALRTQEALAELKPPVSLRLTFPPRANCEKWEGVVGAVTSGIEMKRQLDRVQSEIRVAQSRGFSVAASSSTSAGAIHSARSGSAAARSVTPRISTAVNTSISVAEEDSVANGEVNKDLDGEESHAIV